MNVETTNPLARIADLPGVSDAVQETRTVVDRLLGHRVLRRRSADVSLEAALRGARASAALEGSDVALERLRTGAGDNPHARGALRVSGELGRLVETWPKAPRQVLARLHVLAAADTAATETLGRPREEDAAVADPLELGAAPPPADVTRRLDALSELLAVRTSVPAPVTGAIVHGELLALRPFGWGDGIVARAAERLTLIERGLDPKSLVPAELGHYEAGNEYRTAVRGYLTGRPEGVAEWVIHCARAIATGARESLATCEALQRG